VPPCKRKKRKNSGFRGQWSLKIIESGTKVVRFESLSTVSYSQSIVTMAVSCIISEIKQDIGQKSRYFIPPEFDACIRGILSCSEFFHDVWYGKARVVWLSNTENSLMIRLAVSTEYQRVTDKQTDIFRQHHSPRYAWHCMVRTDVS